MNQKELKALEKKQKLNLEHINNIKVNIESLKVKKETKEIKQKLAAWNEDLVEANENKELYENIFKIVELNDKYDKTYSNLENYIESESNKLTLLSGIQENMLEQETDILEISQEFESTKNILEKLNEVRNTSDAFVSIDNLNNILIKAQNDITDKTIDKESIKKYLVQLEEKEQDMAKNTVDALQTVYNKDYVQEVNIDSQFIELKRLDNNIKDTISELELELLKGTSDIQIKIDKLKQIEATNKLLMDSVGNIPNASFINIYNNLFEKLDKNVDLALKDKDLELEQMKSNKNLIEEEIQELENEVVKSKNQFNESIENTELSHLTLNEDDSLNNYNQINEEIKQYLEELQSKIKLEEEKLIELNSQLEEEKLKREQLNKRINEINEIDPEIEDKEPEDLDFAIDEIVKEIQNSLGDPDITFEDIQNDEIDFSNQFELMEKKGEIDRLIELKTLADEYTKAQEDLIEIENEISTINNSIDDTTKEISSLKEKEVKVMKSADIAAMLAETFSNIKEKQNSLEQQEKEIFERTNKTVSQTVQRSMKKPVSIEELAAAQTKNSKIQSIAMNNPHLAPLAKVSAKIGASVATGGASNLLFVKERLANLSSAYNDGNKVKTVLAAASVFGLGIVVGNLADGLSEIDSIHAKEIDTKLNGGIASMDASDKAMVLDSKEEGKINIESTNKESLSETLKKDGVLSEKSITTNTTNVSKEVPEVKVEKTYTPKIPTVDKSNLSNFPKDIQTDIANKVFDIRSDINDNYNKIQSENIKIENYNKQIDNAKLQYQKSTASLAPVIEAYKTALESPDVPENEKANIRTALKSQEEALSKYENTYKQKVGYLEVMKNGAKININGFKTDIVNLESDIKKIDNFTQDINVEISNIKKVFPNANLDNIIDKLNNDPSGTDKSINTLIEVLNNDKERLSVKLDNEISETKKIMNDINTNFWGSRLDLLEDVDFKNINKDDLDNISQRIETLSDDIENIKELNEVISNNYINDNEVNVKKLMENIDINNKEVTLNGVEVSGVMHENVVNKISELKDIQQEQVKIEKEFVNNLNKELEGIFGARALVNDLINNKTEYNEQMKYEGLQGDLGKVINNDNLTLEEKIKRISDINDTSYTVSNESLLSGNTIFDSKHIIKDASPKELEKLIGVEGVILDSNIEQVRNALINNLNKLETNLESNINKQELIEEKLNDLIIDEKENLKQLEKLETKLDNSSHLYKGYSDISKATKSINEMAIQFNEIKKELGTETVKEVSVKKITTPNGPGM